MVTQTQIADGATVSAAIPFPNRAALYVGLNPDRDPAPACPDCGSQDWGHATPCKRRTLASRVPTRTELLRALRDALDAVDYARQQCHPAVRETLDVLTDSARATYAGCRS